VPDLSGTRRRRRRDVALAISILLFAFLLLFGPSSWSRPVRLTLRATALKPFVAMRGWIAARRAEREDLRVVRAERDSLAAVATAQAVLAEENARLRGLLGLSARVPARFAAAQLLRLGTGAAEGTFLIDIGTDQGVVVGSPVFTVGGLVGVVREVSRHSAQAIDWTHGEFRVSGMMANGDVYGIIEPRRGAYREEDLLLMTGAPFHSDVRPGSRIVTSGRGEVFPRGVPIGEVLGIESADTGWRKSYIIRPYVRPESAAQVLVGIGTGALDLSMAWETGAAAPAPTAKVEVPDTLPGPPPSRVP
jgi:rod shape-determining protein MreC